MSYLTIRITLSYTLRHTLPYTLPQLTFCITLPYLTFDVKWGWGLTVPRMYDNQYTDTDNRTLKGVCVTLTNDRGQ